MSIQMIIQEEVPELSLFTSINGNDEDNADDDDDTSTMPPPRKLMRRGSRELEDAVRVGNVQLSLPKQDWTSWISTRSDDDDDDDDDDHEQCWESRCDQQEQQIGNEEERDHELLSSSSSSHHHSTMMSNDQTMGSSAGEPTSSNTVRADAAAGVAHSRSPSPSVQIHGDGDGETRSPGKADSPREYRKPRNVHDHHHKDKDGADQCSPPRSGVQHSTQPLSPRRPDSSSSSSRLLPRFSDIIGHNAVKLRLDEVLLPLALPPAIADSILVGVRSLSASILLFGPPGCGKTQLAKAIAGEAEAAFLSAGPSDILSKFVGESEASIRSFFDKAYEQARLVESKCAVLFFDEIDALGQSRGGGGGGSGGGASGMAAGASSSTDPSSRRVLAELLIQLNRINANHGRGEASGSTCCSSSRGAAGGGDGGGGASNTDEMSACSSSIEEHFEESSEQHEVSQQVSSSESNKASSTSTCGNPPRIIVVAATNRPEDCDPALLRRFAVRVIVNLPSRRDRKKILKRYLTNIHHTVSPAQLDALSLETEGWTGSDLESLTREAAMAPVRECIRSAALLKRRNSRMEQQQQQRGGTSTCQESSSGSSDDRESIRHDDDSQERILEQFENLRPVSIQDFEDAIAFWAYNQGSADPTSTADGGEMGCSFNGQTIHLLFPADNSS